MLVSHLSPLTFCRLSGNTETVCSPLCRVSFCWVRVPSLWGPCSAGEDVHFVFEQEDTYTTGACMRLLWRINRSAHSSSTKMRDSDRRVAIALSSNAREHPESIAHRTTSSSYGSSRTSTQKQSWNAGLITRLARCQSNTPAQLAPLLHPPSPLPQTTTERAHLHSP